MRLGTLIALMFCAIFGAQALFGVWPNAQLAQPAAATKHADGTKVDPLDIVLIADTSGPNKDIGTEMASGVQDAISHLGLNEDVRLVVRDEGGRPEAVSALADGAAAGFHTLAMVGPTETAGFDAVNASAREGQVVALMPIGAPVDGANSKWAFTLQSSSLKAGEVTGRIIQRSISGERVVMITSPGDLAQQVAAPTAPADPAATATPTTTPDGFWRGLTAAYQGHPGSSARQMGWPAAADAQRSTLADAGQSDAVVLALPADDAETALRGLKTSGYRGLILARGDGSMEKFAERFRSDPRERIDPGFFTNNVVSPVPFTPRIAGPDGQKLISEYAAKHGREPSWAYAYGYDAGLLLSQFVGEAKARGKLDLSAPDRMRSALLDFLNGAGARGHHEDGFTGSIAFSPENQRDMPPKLVRFSGGLQTPFFEQMSSVPVLTDSVTEKTDFVALGPVSYRLIPSIQTGLQILKVSNVNYDRGTFDAEFAIWLKSLHGTDLGEFQFNNQVGELKSVKLSSDIAEMGERYRNYIVSGTFKFNIKPADAILSRPTIGISFRHKHLDRSQLLLVKDTNIPPSTAGNGGYKILSDYLAIGDSTSDAFGDPRGTNGALVYSSGMYEADTIANNPGLASTIVRQFGKAPVALALLALAAVLAALEIARLLRPHSYFDWPFFIIFMFAALLSECSFFIAPLTNNLSQDFINIARYSYSILYIALTVRLLDLLVFRTILHPKSTTDTPPVVVFIGRGFLYFSGAAFFYTQVLGRDLLPILATSSVVLTVIGLALRDLIFDAIAGIAIGMDGHVKIGNWVQIRARERVIHGQVTAWGWRQVTVKSRDNQIHFVPNSAFATQVLSNLTPEDGYVRLEVFFLAATRAPVAEMNDLLALRLPAVLREQDHAIDWARGLRVFEHSLEGEVTRCVVQFFFANDQGTDGVRSAVLEVARGVLVEFEAVPERHRKVDVS